MLVTETKLSTHIKSNWKIEDWEGAKRELRRAGYRVTHSAKSCRTGCCAEVDIKDGEKILWQSANRWDSQYGGRLNHDNLEPEDFIEIFEILQRYDIEAKWSGEYHKNIGINLGEGL